MSYIVSNLLLFAVVKMFGVIMIVGAYRTINEKYKGNSNVQSITSIGQKLIILMYVFVIFNNVFVIQASALSFNNLSVGGTGQINTGNGYFDNPSSQFSYSGTRNIYVLSENTAIWILEPISYSSSGSAAVQLINSSFGTIEDAVIHNGYLYFIDGTTLKKRSGHSNTDYCESNDTSAGGCITTIATGIDTLTLRVYDGSIYFISGGVLKTLDEFDSAQTVFNIGAAAPGGGTVYSSFAITENNGVLTAYILLVSSTNWVKACTSVGCTNVYNTGSNNLATFTTMFATTNYIYIDWHCNGCGLSPTGEKLIRISNGTATSIDYSSTDDLHQNSRGYVGSSSTVGLMSQSTSVYETFSSVEIGQDSLPVTPKELEYGISTIESLQSSYYNRSDIYLQYNVMISSLNVNNALLDFGDYRWMIAMTDPNGVSTDIIQSPECFYSNIFDTTCSVDSTLGMHAPPNGWIQGIWTAELYEININSPNRALIATSEEFVVLNTTVENQSVIPPPIEGINSGSAPQAISDIDQMVAWLGMGINSVSKLLFAMIWIAAFGVIGLYKSNGNIAMALSFVPYGFFTFIDYIPRWMFVIYIILLAIVSKAFR